MNYAIKQRLRFIEFLLVHYGAVGRYELMDFFGISPAQATRDFRLYKQNAPTNVYFDERQKKYHKSDLFKPIY